MDDSPQDNDPNKKNGKTPIQNILFWIILLTIPIVLFTQVLGKETGKLKELTQNEFKAAIADGHVRAAHESLTGGYTGYIKFLITVEKKGEKAKKEKETGKYLPNKFSMVTDLETIHKLIDEYNALAKKNPEMTVISNKIEVQDNSLSDFLRVVAPFVIILIIIYFLFARQLKGAGKGAMQFGKSKAKLMTPSADRVTFKDVAGVEEAREEVEEIVDFLRDPAKYRNLGGRLPKGCLMVGPPGTGKTLLAKAIAGEAGVPFYSMSGSDFVEMFVGVGASRVRDMFEQAKKHQPCILFIDEIDAVGRARSAGGGGGGGHDEREQTLNALLVEMDGFENQHGVIVLAATNRAEVLDKALLRPGRFDRQITVNLADVDGRLEILKVHAKKVKMDDSVDLSIIARGSAGFSGADLANILNEAALLAARLNKKAITHDDLEEARDKVRWGKERKSMKMTEKELRNTAYHEAGHTLVGLYCDKSIPLHKVTIMPRGNAYLGATMYLPDTDSYSQSYEELLDHIAVCTGGRIAEELTFGDFCTGASGDIQQATGTARRMITHWGMSEDLGFLLYSTDDNPYSPQKEYSENTAQRIDTEVKKIVDTQYARARKILTDHQDKLILLSETLLKKETMTAKEVHELLDIPLRKQEDVIEKKDKIEDDSAVTEGENKGPQEGLETATNS